jgi:hypothetical protein
VEAPMNLKKKKGIFKQSAAPTLAWLAGTACWDNGICTFEKKNLKKKEKESVKQSRRIFKYVNNGSYYSVISNLVVRQSMWKRHFI